MQCFEPVDAHDLRKQILALALLAGCAGTPPVAPAPVSPSAAHETRGPLAFIEDDYPRALADAKRKGKPLFVDAWAPWCHSCLSMRAFVLRDPKLAVLADDYVWLAIDTERAENAAFVARFTNEAWPTLWVIDPVREEPVLKWAGTATADELRSLLEATRAGASEAAIELVKGSRAVASGDLDGAEARFRAALAKKPDEQRPRIVDALVNVLYRKKAFDACAETAAQEASALPPGTPRAEVLAIGLSCAIQAKKTKEAAALEALALSAALEEDGKTLADDRSSLFEEVVAARDAAGDAAGKKIVAEKWAAFLEREAGRAKTKEARAVFDAHRLSAYIALGAPERAIPMLLESERDFPDDYNPPARLARAYLELSRLDDAQKAIERAEQRVYGPRALRVLALAADIAKARGDRAAERAALERAIARTETSVLTEGQKKLRSSLIERLGRP